MDENIVVQPDLFFVGKQTPIDMPLDGWITGSPDLAIEILSPSNARHDLVRKRELYARYRIPEYWIVDPLARSIVVLTLEGGAYAERRPAHLEGAARLQLERARIFRRGLFVNRRFEAMH